MSEIKLQSPLKTATTRAGWTHSLTSVNDLLSCVFQTFGEDLSGPACNWLSTLPCSETLYQSLGLKGHNGLDIACPDRVEIIASHDGLASVSVDNYGAKFAVVATAGFKTIYGHFKDFSVNTGQQVKQGDVLGHADCTGLCSGTHLHYGLKLLDSQGNVLNRDNGYDGAVDPTPYLEWFMIDSLTIAEMQALQALEGFNDPTGQQYWAGKPLKAELLARLEDKLKDISAAIAALQNDGIS